MKLDDATTEIRGRVLLAAGALFYARGIQEVGMDDIRAASGVSLKRLYQLFGSKDELVTGYLQLMGRRWDEGLARHLAAAADPRNKVLAVFDWLAAWFAEEDFRGCAFVNCFAELGGTTPAVASAARAHKRHFRAELEGLVARLGGPADLAGQLALVAEGAITTSALTGSAEPARQARRIATVLLDAHLPARE
jgi:AcrR family transcriptional regulator